MLKLHNTLTRQREPFEPSDPERVTMYVCGPTVYNLAHIGNARPFVVFDVLSRLLRRRYRLRYVRNITDVDDKINAAARAEGIPIGELTARYTQAFHEDMAGLGVTPPDVEPRVTEHIERIVDMIERLVVAGNAYVAEEHVLFAVGSYAAYGKLSGRSRDDMIAGARVEVAPYKRDPGDFVLWKPSAADEVGWDSPWGRGRPGWHIECSTMAEAHLGETIDIHGGGLDLVFPHHENERAQSCCAHGGKPFARYWVHNGLVNVDSEKMSKSLGNMMLIRDLLAAHPGEAIRLALLTAHYRQPLDWSERLVLDAKRRLDRMYGALRDAGVEGGRDEAPTVELPAGVVDALADDLNTPDALAALAALVRDVNRTADATERLGEPLAEPLAERRALAETLRAGAWMLGLLQLDPAAWFSQAAPAGAQSGLTDGEIDDLVRQRDELRKSREFAAADKIRDDLDRMGIVIEDRQGGSRWRRK